MNYIRKGLVNGKLIDEVHCGIYGDCIVVKKSHILKTQVAGWMLAMKYADMDIHCKLNVGDEVIVCRTDDSKYVAVKEMQWHEHKLLFVSDAFEGLKNN